MQLRPYQSSAITDVSGAYRAGHQGVMLVMPTGSGKTVVFSRVAKGVADANGVTLILVPHKELIEQTSDKLGKFGIRHGIIAASFNKPDPAASTQLAMVQTLLRRPGALVRQPSLIVGDEAHLSVADSWQTVLDRYRNAKRLLATATPWRLDGQGFESVATAMVIATDVPQLNDVWRADNTQGLVPAETYSVPVIDVAGLHKNRSGEFDPREQAEAYEKQQLIGDVVAHYVKYAGNRQGIVFASGKKHAESLAAQFNACGIRAACVFGDTPPEVRKLRLAQLTYGELQVICNYGVLTEGFDCPPVSVVSIARATASKSLWLQMAGRCMRPFPGKFICIILDHGGNAVRHGGVAFKHPWSLLGRDKREKDPEEGTLAKICKQCAAVMPSQAVMCTVCGYIFATVRRDDLPVSVSGDLIRIAADIAPMDGPAIGLEPAPRPAIRRRDAESAARDWTARMNRVS